MSGVGVGLGSAAYAFRFELKQDGDYAVCVPRLRVPVMIVSVDGRDWTDDYPVRPSGILSAVEVEKIER